MTMKKYHPFEILAALDCKSLQKPNEHGRVEITALVRRKKREEDQAEDRSSVDTYVYQIFENQQDISKDEIPATGDKYSIGNLAMFPGYTNDSSQEIAELFLAYLGNVADDYSKF